RNDSVAEVSTIIRAGRSERTHTRPESEVTSPACTPQPALGRPDRAKAGAAPRAAGTVRAADAAREPRRTLRRPGNGRCDMRLRLHGRDAVRVHCHNYWCATAHTQTRGEQRNALTWE